MTAVRVLILLVGFGYLACMLCLVLLALGYAIAGFWRTHLRRWNAPLLEPSRTNHRLWDRDPVESQMPRVRRSPPYIVRRRDGTWVGIVHGADDAECASRLIELCK